MDKPVLKVEHLKTYFYLDEGTLKAVDGVTFQVAEKGTLGVIGESGCGKSVTAQSILRIVPTSGKLEPPLKYDDHYGFNRFTCVET